MRTFNGVRLAALLFCAAVFLVTPPAGLSQAQEKDRDKVLVDLLAAARKEGKVAAAAAWDYNVQQREQAQLRVRELLRR